MPLLQLEIQEPQGNISGKKPRCFVEYKLHCQGVDPPSLQTQACESGEQIKSNTETPVLGDGETFIPVGQSKRTEEQDLSNLSSQKAKAGSFYVAREYGRQHFREPRESLCYLQSQITFCATRLLGVSS